MRRPRLDAQMQTLAEPMRVDRSFKDVAGNAFAGDAEALLSNGQFL